MAEAGGLPFKDKVEVAFLRRDELGAYLREIFDVEYPEALARSDERLLQAFDLLPPGTEPLRALRARVLEDDVAGFYDERPGKRRLYAVSDDRSFSPMNQVILAHELRHAQQDQYQTLDGFLDEDVSDFDDRRLAWTSLLEGDATLVMERFVRLRLGSLGAARAEQGEAGAGLETAGLFDVPGAPPVRAGPAGAALYRGAVLCPGAVGARGCRGDPRRPGDGRPPRPTRFSTGEYFAREAPRTVRPAVEAPRGATLLSEGVLGEMLLRTLVEGAGDAATSAAGGDSSRLSDVAADRPGVAQRVGPTGRCRGIPRRAALVPGAPGEPSTRGGWAVFRSSGAYHLALRRVGDAVEIVSSDDSGLLERGDRDQ